MGAPQSSHVEERGNIISVDRRRRAQADLGIQDRMKLKVGRG